MLRSLVSSAKLFLLAALTVSSTFPLYASGDHESAPPVELVIAFPSDPPKLKSFRYAADQYTDSTENLTIRLLSIPGWEYDEKILSMISAGDPLDVIDINTTLYEGLKDRLVDLTDHMRQSGYFDDTDGLYPGWLDFLATDGNYNPDNDERFFQAPLRTGTTVLAYNKRMFDEAKLTYPDATWTWNNEFLAAAKALTKNNTWGVSGVNSGFIHYALVGAYGGNLFGLDENGELRFSGNTDAAVNALQYLQDLIYTETVAPTPAQQAASGGSGLNMFKRGLSAMYFLNTHEFPQLYDFDEDWDIEFLPKGPEGAATTIYGDRLAVPDSTSDASRAWNFIDLMNRQVGQDSFDTYYGVSDPALQSVAKNYVFAEGAIGAPSRNRIRTEALSKQHAIVVDPPIPNANSVYAQLEEQLHRIWLNEIAPADAMSYAEQYIKPLLSREF